MKFSHSQRLEVIDLGRADYAETTQLMLELVDEIVAGEKGDHLLLAEFDSVLTVGRGAKSSAYEQLGVPVHDISRGGKVTYHGPGQLVIYPIIALRDKARDLHAYLHALEAAMINVVGDFDLTGVRDERNTGCWVNNHKVASIGVAVRKWVTYHGVALNVNTDLDWFKRFDPCGLEPDVMTSMQQQLASTVDMVQVKNSVVNHLQQTLTDDHR
ncbi:MAG TPA: lipoyl(octanoyl) transferase LipB [Planctomycetes bacterium]|jgi:lipoate-protein ligase B|nr:lipoyl(octanoyl) transferase LipB [Planctomycetota bacterium]